MVEQVDSPLVKAGKLESWAAEIHDANAEVHRCAVELAEASQTVAVAKAAEKARKTEWESAVSKLVRLIDSDRKDAERPLLAKAEEKAEQAGQRAAWSDVLISESLGLTAKELELLEEAGVRTIGEIESLRAGAGLTSIKGIGQGKADKIEERILSWLDNNRDVEVMQEAKAEPETPAVLSIIQRRVEELLPGDYMACVSESTWQAGHLAFNEGHNYDHCPFGPGENQDDWLRGWLAAGKEDESQKPEEDADEFDSVFETNGVQE